MKNIYLKEMTKDDLELLIEYNNDYYKHFPNAKPSINENNYVDILDKWDKSREDEKSMHLYPYWFMRDGIAIGMTILKTNIQANQDFSKYGGHISYNIAPSYRKKGYGTICCHLAIEKCKKLGLKEVMIGCNIDNIGSRRIIENNYGVLKDIAFQNTKGKQHGLVECRYIVNVENSLTKYNSKEPVKRTTIKGLCNVNRDNLEDFLINNYQCEIGEETLKFAETIGEINNIEDIASLYQTFIEEFKPDTNREMKKFERTTEEIVKSKMFSGCNDAGLVLSTILRMKNVPTIFVSSGHIDWIKDLQENNEDAKAVRGHIFLEIYLNDKWYLFDSMAGQIYDNYDYNNLSLPKGYYAFRKTLNNHNFGAYTLEDNNKIMCEIFKDFDLNEYKEPNYECIELKTIKSSFTK